MKRLFLFVAAALLSGAAAHPELAQIHSVYVLPMAGSLDQLLAIRITERSLFTVVTDPRKADAIFTARIGPAFEDALKELYASMAKDEAKDKDKDKDKLSDNYTRPTMKPLSRAKGSVFLVDRKTGVVLWSVYEPAGGNSNSDVQRLAQRIAGRLEKDLKSK